MMLLKSTFASLLLALLVTAPVKGNDDDGGYNDDGYNAPAQVTVCADAIVQVQELSILCDSPGAYYYGSGKYRNSATCLPGDKAKVVLDFYIADPDTIQYGGGSVLTTIEVDGSYIGYKKLYENAELCELQSLTALSGNGCPAKGYYQIESQFYWGKSNNGYDTSFYPSVTVGFKSSIYQNAFDLGGANTDDCRGSTFVTWTNRVRTTYANAVSNFIKTFGILLFTIAIMGSFIWFLINKPRSLKDAKAKLIPNGRQEEVFDFRKLPTGAGKNIQLVDF